MDDLDKGMRELAKTSVTERPRVPPFAYKDNPAPNTRSRILDELSKANEENIAKLRGQIARLSTYIDRLVGTQPEEIIGNTINTISEKAQPNGKITELFELNGELDREIRRLVIENERLDVL